MDKVVTDKDYLEIARQAPYTYAAAICHLLGDNWFIRGGWFVTNGQGVEIDAQQFSVMWLDLAPDGEIREQRTIQMPTYSSIGATVAVARALASLDS